MKKYIERPQIVEAFCLGMEEPPKWFEEFLQDNGMCYDGANICREDGGAAAFAGDYGFIDSRMAVFFMPAREFFGRYAPCTEMEYTKEDTLDEVTGDGKAESDDAGA